MDDKDFLKKLGLKIKILRNIKKLSQDDIANRLNIDKSYYSKLERGLANPTVLYLLHLADIFEIECAELLDFNINL
jgi:transcriptional regulator with XRE-family HTH domain